jgi:hypothetical protein
VRRKAIHHEGHDAHAPTFIPRDAG